MARSADIRIGELSRQTGCNVETIRYYEHVGVLPRPPRSAARYRLYDIGDGLPGAESKLVISPLLTV